MSPKNLPILVGLAAPGLLWLATSVASAQVEPPRAASPAPTYAALLLSNGKVIRGVIVEDAPAKVFRHRTSAGTIAYPKMMVEKAAGSVEELYQYRLSRLPTADPDERIKLAKWCLAEKLPAQAREQLIAVSAMCPENEDVDRMLKNVSANTERPKDLDPEARQAGFETPAPLDPRVVGRVRRSYGNALPVIFDLPPAQAVPRASEFAKQVQPILLQNCARCHNDKYTGDFQLIEIKSSRDRQNPDISRANLDATLRLINPDDPSRSDLLSAGLVPHGPNKNAIFTGPNDRQYSIMANWAKSLRPSPSSSTRPANDGMNRTGFRPSESPASTEGFASDRGSRAPRTTNLPALPGMGVLSAGIASSPPPPSQRIVNRYDESADFSGKPEQEFSVPYVVGGLPPIPKAPPRTPDKPRPPSPSPLVKQVSPGAVVVGVSDSIRELPGMDQPLYRSSPGAAPADDPIDPAGASPEPTKTPEPAAAKKARSKIDPALLEKMMKTRNAGP